MTMMKNLSSLTSANSRSPILFRIVHGSSSTSMDLIREGRREDLVPRLFSTPSFYNTIIFKYPNFQVLGQSDGRLQPPPDDDRPVETGIYIPNNPDAPMGGGAAIYPRRKNNGNLLEEYLGLSRNSARTLCCST
jgi:hypothetical protein